MRSLKVLILEDSPFQLMALHQMLNACQVFDVLVADSVAAAQLSLSKRGAVDIAICDLQMDGPDGFELIRLLARDKLAQALIILSNAERGVLDGAAHLARQQGIEVLGSLQKPASVATLRQLMDHYHDLEARRSVQLPTPRLFSLEELHQVTPDQRPGEQSLSEQWVAYFQPKTSLEGDLLGVEALARWQHPRHGLLSPGSFMSAVEHAGLLGFLTWRMLDQALQLSADYLHSKGQILPVAVNIAPIMLEQPDFAHQVMQRLRHFEVPAHALTLEIIEQSTDQTADWHLESLLRLRLQGCKLSIDDFGTGASNIQRLLQMPFSELKIPAEFVRGMGDDGRKSAVVAGAMFMARRMGLEVVVEGVETLDDFHSVQVLGGAAVQGYFVARPLTAQELMEWIEARVEPDDDQPRPCSCK